MRLRIRLILLYIGLWSIKAVYANSATPPQIEATKKKYELSIAAMFQNEASRLKEWIEYHRIVGVEHFYLYNDRSTDNWQDVIAPYVKEGLIEIFDWPTTSRSSYYDSYCTTQVNIYKDALTRAENVSEWLTLIDVDEFILPMRDSSTIPECLNKFFTDASGIYVNWRHFGTNNVTLGQNDLMISKLTACSNRTHTENFIGKSIVKPHQVRISNIGYPHHFPLKEGQNYYNADREMIEVHHEKAGRHDYLRIDHKHHDSHIRINHYRMGDEHYFNNVRLPRQKRFGRSESQLWQEYHAYNQEKDEEIILFLKEKHPKKYEELRNMLLVL